MVASRSFFPRAPWLRGARRGTLFGKYISVFLGVVSISLLANGLLTLWFSYNENRHSLARIQKQQAEATASKISQFFREIERQVGWTTQLAWPGVSIEQRRFDALRLLRQVPPITELSLIDDKGFEQLRVSRLAMEKAASHVDFSSDPKFTQALANGAYYGPVYFRRESEPYMTVALSGTRRESGVSVAEVNLKFIWAVVTQIDVGKGGNAFVIDSQGQLVAHTDLSLVLRKVDMLQSSSVRSAVKPQGGLIGADYARDDQGRQVLTTHAEILPTGWKIFIEQPLAEVHAPLYQLISRFVILLLTALLLATMAGLLLTRRIMAPIKELGSGAARIGGGDLAYRISINSRDELEGLGEQFNEMAAELEAAYATLEQKVSERTHQLARANRAQRRFLAVASHDLRQPLHAIGLFIGQLRACANHGDQEQILDHVDSALHMMNELFDALLDLSQLDAGVLVPHLSVFPVAQLLDRVENIFATSAREKGLRLRIVRCKSWIESDPILLERIVMNLVSNAVRYTQFGSVLIGCRQRGFELQIDVLDSGSGIPEQQQDRIFREFVRLSRRDSQRQRGLGLGLAIVQRLCELLGHTIVVRSVLNKGSHFAVQVPLALRREISLPMSEKYGLLPGFQGRLVCIIDDDALVLEATSQLLRGWGCNAVTFLSASEAVSQLEQHGLLPDLIIADLNLSGGDTGIAAIEAVRLRLGADVPAFLISADAEPGRIVDLRAMGYRLLRKPLSPVMLRAAMLSVFQ